MSKVWPRDKDSRYAPYDSDPQGLLGNVDVMAELYKQIDELHLIDQQQEIQQRALAPTTPITPSTPGE